MYINDLEYIGCNISFKRVIKRKRKYRLMECEVNFYGKVMKGKAKMYKSGGAYFIPDRKRDVIFLSEAYNYSLEKKDQPLSKRALKRSSVKIAANLFVIFFLYFISQYGALLSISFKNGHMYYVGYYYIIQMMLASVFLIISFKMRKLVHCF